MSFSHFIASAHNVFLTASPLHKKLEYVRKSYFGRKKLKFRMRVKFRNKSSEWKGGKNIKQMRGDSTTYLTAGGHEGHDATKMFKLKMEAIQALFHLTRNIHMLYTNGACFFFFLFHGQEKSITFFFFSKKMSACSAGDDGEVVPHQDECSQVPVSDLEF